LPSGGPHGHPYYESGFYFHSKNGDDTNFHDADFPYARLSKLKVKRLDSPVKLLFCINGTHSWIQYGEFPEEEQNEREKLYIWVVTDKPKFFTQYDEPLLRYCFADSVLALRYENN